MKILKEAKELVSAKRKTAPLTLAHPNKSRG